MTVDDEDVVKVEEGQIFALDPYLVAEFPFAGFRGGGGRWVEDHKGGG
jgi:hypothetical protein